VCNRSRLWPALQLAERCGAPVLRCRCASWGLGVRITSTTAEGVTVLEVSGEVDLETADQLREAAINALSPYAGTLRIDLAGVTFMDSSGLAALIQIRKRAGAAHQVVIQNPRPNVQRILAITGLDKVFEGRPPRSH
jgi:anti-sigma B factor antagonist